MTICSMAAELSHVDSQTDQQDKDNKRRHRAEVEVNNGNGTAKILCAYKH